jgi:RimJ/RimL family protein N-acetyltransferase
MAGNSRVRSRRLQPSRTRIDWTTSSGQLLAIEPSPDEVLRHAGVLAAAYNDPRNAPLLGHTEPMTPADVVAHYANLAAEGARNFLFLRDGALAGDGDLRNVRGGAAEFAFLIAAVAAQGQGLGTRFAIMLHAFGFTELALDRIYASVVPANVASRRVFEKLGYHRDDSPAARAFADEPGDVVMAVDRVTFGQVHGPEMAEIRLAVR